MSKERVSQERAKRYAWEDDDIEFEPQAKSKKPAGKSKDDSDDVGHSKPKKSAALNR